jgi:hypothetical protein
MGWAVAATVVALVMQAAAIMRPANHRFIKWLLL